MIDAQDLARFILGRYVTKNTGKYNYLDPGSEEPVAGKPPGVEGQQFERGVDLTEVRAVPLLAAVVDLETHDHCHGCRVGNPSIHTRALELRPALPHDQASLSMNKIRCTGGAGNTFARGKGRRLLCPGA
jgi:hypothetical protein